MRNEDGTKDPKSKPGHSESPDDSSVAQVSDAAASDSDGADPRNTDDVSTPTDSAVSDESSVRNWTEPGAGTPESAEVNLAAMLLHQPVPDDDRPGQRWAYSSWGTAFIPGLLIFAGLVAWRYEKQTIFLGIVAAAALGLMGVYFARRGKSKSPALDLVTGLWGAVVSFFVLFHVLILLVHNTPIKGLGVNVHKEFNDKLQMRNYMRTIGSSQSWAMFAPNPHRSNLFMKVMVKDSDGEIWDLKHDIWKKRSYPYLWYDRMGKINRRIIDQKGYRRHYAAWVCREWERHHEGVPADEIMFVKMWTRIPPPEKVYKHMYYDPTRLKLHQRDEDGIKCKSTRHGQLPDYLRERHGLSPLEDEKTFRGVYLRTWFTKQESERKAAERKAQAQAGGAK